MALDLTPALSELVLFLGAMILILIGAIRSDDASRLLSPLTILTLGLFTLVINALMLMLTGWLTSGGVSTVDFWSALLGALIISIISTVLSWVLVENN